MSPRRQTNGSPQAQYRRRRRAELAGYVVDGVSTHPDCPHGKSEGYDLYGCRCDPCGDTNTRYKTRRQNARVQLVTSLLEQSPFDFPETPPAGAPETVTKPIVAASVVDIWLATRGDRRQRSVASYLRGAALLLLQHDNTVNRELTHSPTGTGPAAELAERIVTALPTVTRPTVTPPGTDTTP